MRRLREKEGFYKGIAPTAKGTQSTCPRGSGTVTLH